MLRKTCSDRRPVTDRSSTVGELRVGLGAVAPFVDGRSAESPCETAFTEAMASALISTGAAPRSFAFPFPLPSSTRTAWANRVASSSGVVSFGFAAGRAFARVVLAFEEALAVGIKML